MRHHQGGSGNLMMTLTLPTMNRKLSDFNNSDVHCHFEVHTRQSYQHTDSYLAHLTVLLKSGKFNNNLNIQSHYIMFTDIFVSVFIILDLPHLNNFLDILDF